MSNNNSKLALVLASTWILAGEIAPSVLAQAGGPPFTITNLADSGPGSLRQAILDANARPGPDMIDFAPGLHGTIVLTSGVLTITDSLAINGPGAWWMSVNGNHASRVFEIEGAANTVSISGLAITQGLAGGNAANPGMGGGILLVSGSLTLSQVILSDNRAVGGTIEPTSASNPGTAGGGGVFNISGNLRVMTSAILGNHAVGGNGGDGLGGGILSFGPFTLSNSAIAGNSALGGSGGVGLGGGIFVEPAALSSVENSLFLGNQAVGGNGMTGGAGGAGQGGGIFSDNGTLTITNVTIIGNQALGGNGSDGGQGGNGLGGGLFVNSAASVDLDASRIIDNLAQGGTGGTGGQGVGGGIYDLGNLKVGPSSTVVGNRASTADPNFFPPR
jgi:hypothetical protein